MTGRDDCRACSLSVDQTISHMHNLQDIGAGTVKTIERSEVFFKCPYDRLPVSLLAKIYVTEDDYKKNYDQTTGMDWRFGSHNPYLNGEDRSACGRG